MKTVKLLFLIFLFFLISESFGKTIPPAIMKELQSSKISSQSVVITIDPKDCASCTAYFYKIVANIYKDHPDNLFCFASSNADAGDLLYFLTVQGVVIPRERIVVNPVLLNWFAKKAKAGNYILMLNGNGYSYFDTSGENKDAYAAFSYLYENINYKATVTDTITYDFGFLPTTANCFDLDEKNIYALNLSSNRFYVCNQASRNLKILNLDSLIDQQSLLKSLHLKERDYQLTLKENVNSRIEGEKFLNIESFDLVKDKIYFSCYAKYTHEMTHSELQEMRKIIGKSMAKLLAKDSVAYIDRVEFFIFEFGSDYKLLNAYPADTITSEYSVEGYSGLTYNSNTNEFIFNTSYNSQLYKDKESYIKKNYVCGRFKWNDQNKKIAFSGFIPFTYPEWYGRKGVLGNYSNGKFQRDPNGDFFYLSSYPYFLDVTSEIEFKIPESKLKEISKREGNDFLTKDQPAFFTLGVCSFSEKEIVLLFRGRKSNNVYAAVFNPNGHFMNSTIIMQSKAWLGYARYFNKTLHIPLMDYDSLKKSLYLVHAKVSN